MRSIQNTFYKTTKGVSVYIEHNEGRKSVFKKMVSRITSSEQASKLPEPAKHADTLTKQPNNLENQATAKLGSADNALLVCFESLVNEMNTHISADNYPEYTQSLVMEINKIKKLSSPQKKSIAHWLTMGYQLSDTSCAHEISKTQLNQMVSCVYAMLCYHIGPVKADNAMMSSVNHAKQAFEESLVEELL